MRRRLVAIVLAAVVAAGSGYGATRLVTSSGPRPTPAGLVARPLSWQAHEVGPVAFGVVACAGGMRCVAFGPAGSVARSVDGGRSWSLSDLAMLAGLTVRAAVCPGPDRCVAVASGPSPEAPQLLPRGVILLSHDAGRTWRVESVSGPPLAVLGGLSCPSTEVCVATVAPVSSQGRGGFLLVSTDGGVAWTRRQTGPPGGLGAALACPAVGDCYASGGPDGLVQTRDGGLRWSIEQAPGDGMGPAVAAALACSSVTSCVGAGMGGPGFGVLMATSDGGRRWSLRYPSAPPGRYEPGGGYDGVSCAGRRCVAVAAGQPPIGLISESDDAGRTWREIAAGPGGSLSGVTCASAAGCVVSGTLGNGRALLGLLGLLRPGVSWRVTDLGPGTEWSALSCPSPRHCVAGDGTGTIPGPVSVAWTSDGGLPLSYGRLPPGTVGLTALDCPSDRHCVAAGEVATSQRVQQETEVSAVATMLSSDDGGRTWRRDVLDAPLETVAVLSCPSIRACYAVGATLGRSAALPEDALIETTDGGARWSAGVLPAFPPQPPVGTSGSEILGGGLTSVSCFTATSCIAGGPAGVLATSDGTHWSVRYQVPGPGNAGVVIDGMLYGQVQQLTCPGPSRCVAVFDDPNGESLRLSTDGGRSWTRFAAPRAGSGAPSWPPTFASAALACPSLSECLDAGADAEGAVVLESEDGGVRWHTVALPTLGGAAAPIAGVPGGGYDTVACAGPRWCLVLGAGGVGESAIGG